MMAIRHIESCADARLETSGELIRPAQWLPENASVHNNSAQVLEGPKPALMMSEATAIDARLRKGSRILEERLLDTRKELEQRTKEHNRLLNVAKQQAEQLAAVEPLPGLFLARLEDVLQLVEQDRKEHSNPVSINNPEELDRRFNQAIAKIRIVFERDNILENQELRINLTQIQSALAVKREEALNLQVEQEQLTQRFSTVLETLKRFNAEAAAREERIIKLQRYVKESEARHHKLFADKRAINGRKSYGTNEFTCVSSGGSTSSTKRRGWFSSSMSLVLGLTLGCALTFTGVWLSGHLTQKPELGANSTPSLFGNTDPTATGVNSEIQLEPAASAKTTVAVKTQQDVLKSNEFGPELVVVTGGSFNMGTDEYGIPSDLDLPKHKAVVADFLMGRYEVTFNQYDTFARDTGRALPDDRGWGRGRNPVINVTWNDAKAYTQWLSTKTGQIYRLPTEAEWEYAIAGGIQERFWWGKTFVSGQEVCFNCGTKWDGKRPATVGSLAANPLGLYDMGGNVMEWVNDCSNTSGKNLVANSACELRVVRGGAYNKPYDSMRNTARHVFSAKDGLPMVGFRVVRRTNMKL